MILEKIKAATLDNHTRLEESNLLLSFSRKEIDLVSYQTILTRFYGYFQPLEALVDDIPEVRAYLPDYATRRKASLLLTDLQHLDERISSVPLCQALPQVADASQAFGCLYVMEGSTLGGQYLSKVIRDQLGLTVATGAAFFNGYGAETGRMWKAFQQALVAFSEQQGDSEVIIEAANQSFEKFREWINLDTTQR